MCSLVLFYACKFPLIDQVETIKSLLQENTKNIDFILVCLEGLCILGMHDSSLIKNVVEFLVDFLLYPSSLFKTVALSTGGEEFASIIQECAANALANLLDCPNIPPEVSSAKKSTLFACINTMHNSYQTVIAGSSNSNSTSLIKKSPSSSIDLLRASRNEDMNGSGGVGGGGVVTFENGSRKFSNSVATISHLTRVLKPKDVSTVIYSSILTFL